MSITDRIHSGSIRHTVVMRNLLVGGTIALICLAIANGVGAQEPAKEGLEVKPATAAPMAGRVRWRKPASDTAGALGALLNAGTLPEQELQAMARRQEQNAGMLKDQLALWEAALTAAKAPAGKQALVINLSLLEPIYAKDQFQIEKANTYLKRIGSLDQPTIERWKAAFSLSATAAVWDLMQVEALFEGDKFRSAALDAALANAEKRLAEEAETNRLRVAEQKKQLDAEDGERKAAEGARLEKIELAKWRTWVTADGVHRTEAKFISLSSGSVTLEKKDGKKIKVPLDILTAEDQQFIRERKWLK